MPEISQDERGRRVFQLQKQRAIEDAITRIRSNLGQDWKLFSATDIETLKDVLGDAWISADREEWGTIAFSRIGVQELRELIDLGKGSKKEGSSGDAFSRSLMKILKRTLRR